MDQSAILPPVGLIGPNDHGSVIAHLTNLAREAKAAAEEWHAAAESNLTIYVYGSDPQPSSSKVVSNQVQDACNAVTDFQTKDPPIRNLSPVERGEPGQVYYFTPPGPDGQSQVLGPFTPDQAQAMQQPVPATDALGRPLVQMASDPATGAPVPQPMTQPSPYLPQNFVTIDDKSTAEFFQKQLDVWWTRGELDNSMRSCVHYSTIFGFLFPIYEWDKNYHRPRLWTDISLRDIYVDPTRAGVRDMAYAGVDWWIDANQAKAMFPDLADIIEERAHTGTPTRPSSETELGFNVDRVNGSGGFRRNTIILRVFWLRNQPCPYEENEALAAGLLERREIPLGDPGAIIPDEQYQFPRGVATDGANQESAKSPAASMPDQQRGSTQVPTPDAASALAPAAPTRSALFANNVEVTGPRLPDGTLDPNWPMYLCNRQVTCTQDLVVDDREIEYWDFPMLQIVSTAIPYQPFGQGLPARLSAMQDARNDMLSDIRDHIALLAHPVMIVPQSAWDALPDEFKKHGASRAGMTVRLPDHLMEKNPTVATFLNPPPMNQALVDGQNIFHSELTERSGNPDILNGRPPMGVTGWQSIQLLSQNASSRFGFSMQWTKDAYWRLTKLVLHDLTDPKKVTPRDLRAVDSRYPEPIVALFQQRAAMIDFDVDIDIQAGVGSSKNRKQAEAMELYGKVDPITRQPVISTETLRDVTGYDNEQENERNERAAEEAMKLQAQAASMMPPPPAPAGAGPKPPAANGQPDHPQGQINFQGA